MLSPILQSAFVAVVAAVLTIALQALGVEVAEEVVTAIAIGIVAWLIGLAGGARAAASIRGEGG